MTFEEWFDNRPKYDLHGGFRQYLDDIIREGCMNDYIDIMIYLEEAWDAAYDDARTKWGD